MIDEIYWNIAVPQYSSQNNVKDFYQGERTTNVSESDQYLYKANIGMVSISDYGYATSGISKEQKEECLNHPIRTWKLLTNAANSDVVIEGLEECVTYDWMYHNDNFWTITPHIKWVAYPIYEGIEVSGYGWTRSAYNVYPTLYLKEDVKITNGNGTEENPYQVTLNGEQVSVDILGKEVPLVKENDGMYKVSHEDIVDPEMNEGFKEAEYRYAGSNPDNYITFNNEDWRIVGLVNVETTSGNIEQRVKIVRNDSIGEYSWDTSSSDVNSGYGVNEWSKSDLMKLLNPGYNNNQDKDSNGSNITVNNSLYWTGGSGNCYNGQSNITTTCNFTNSLNDADLYIADDIAWNTGAYNNGNPITLQDYYQKERGNAKGNEFCSSNDLCNDSITRTTKWEGKIGLIYATDYFYAMGGNERNQCLTNLNNTCSSDNWLNKSNIYYLITPLRNINEAGYSSLIILSNGLRDSARTSLASNVFPSLYLKNTVIITSGNGMKDSPYEISLN